MYKVRALFFCCIFLLAAGVAQQSTPSFQSRAELVLIPVTVSEGSELVRGLAQSDFTILHDGRPERIAVFDEVDATPARFAPVALPPRTVQNFVATGTHDDVAVLLLDFLNGNWNTAARIRSFLPEISRLFADTHTPVAVLLLSRNGLVQIHSLTNRPDEFAAAVEHATKSGVKLSATPWSNAATPLDSATSASGLNTWGVAPGFIDQKRLAQAEMTLRAIEQIARGFSGVSGRKKLIWMSIGFPSDISADEALASPQAVMLQLRQRDLEFRAWRVLSSANIAVYPLDANGVVNPSWHGGGLCGNTTEVHCNFAPEAAPASWGIPSTDATVPTNTASLLEVAQMTGGTTCTLAPDKCVDKTLKDSGHYYIVGFYLHGEQKPGWHKLKVDVARPGVSVRARNGFAIDSPEHSKPSPQRQSAMKKSFASVPAAQKAGDEAADDPILVALGSPLDYTGIPLRLSWSVASHDASGVKVDLVMSTPPGGIAINDDDKSMNLDFLAYVRTPGKDDGQSYPATLATHLSPQQQRSLVASGFLYRKQLTLKPGRYDVRVLLRDNITRQIGTVSTLVDVTR